MRRAFWLFGLVTAVGGPEVAHAQPLPAAQRVSVSSSVSGLGCGPQAQLAGGVITVRPGGDDDSATLQCALDRAGALGVRDVRLTAGTFHAMSLVANDFHGRLAGAGESRTVIENVPDAYVTPTDFLFTPPSASNPWPSMVALVDGDFVVSQLTIRVTGTPTRGWWAGDTEIRALAHGFVIVGREAHAVFDHVTIEGADLPGDIFGKTVISGIYFEGAIGAAPPPLKGSWAVRDSTFRNLADGTPSSNLSDAHVVITGNTYSGCPMASDTDDLVRSTYLFARNRVVDAEWYGFMLYDYCLSADSNCGTHDSTVSIVGNDFGRSGEGVELVGTLGRSNRCIVAGNEVRDVADMAVYLGPETAGCLVVSGGKVVDEGSDNQVVPR